MSVFNRRLFVRGYAEGGEVNQDLAPDFYTQGFTPEDLAYAKSAYVVQDGHTQYNPYTEAPIETPPPSVQSEVPVDYYISDFLPPEWYDEPFGNYWSSDSKASDLLGGLYQPEKSKPMVQGPSDPADFETYDNPDIPLPKQPQEVKPITDKDIQMVDQIKSEFKPVDATPFELKAAAIANDIPKEKRMSIMEQFGFTPQKENDPWEFVRIMSAQLLTSDESTFFGAWGEGAHLWNKRQADISDANAELRNKIAMKQMEGYYDAEAARAKSALEGKKKLGSELIGGIDYDLYPPDPGQTEGLVKGSDGQWYHGRPKSLDKMHEKLMTQRNAMSEEKMNQIRMVALSGVEYNDEPVYTEKYDEAAHKKAIEAFIKQKETLDDLRANGDLSDENTREQIKSIENSLMNSTAIQSVGSKILKEGKFTELTDMDQAQLYSLLDDKALEIARTQGARPDWQAAYKQAANELMPKINWGIDDATGKFTFDLTEKQIKDTQRQVGDIVGKDLANEWFNWDWLDTAEYPEGDPRRDMDRTPLQLEDEISAFNLNQWELLSGKERNEFIADVGMIASKVSARSRGQITEEQARNDVMSAILKHNTIIAPGEDVLGGENRPAKYFKPLGWYPEPADKRESARSQGYLWDGFRGEWWNPINRKKVPVQNVEKSIPKPIKW